MSQDLVDTFTITAIGMTIVFIVLIVLAMCFSAMKLIAGQKDEAEENAPLMQERVEASAPDVGSADPAEDELAVVISAALAAFLDNRFVVRSVRRLEDTASWSSTGRHDQMVSRLR